MELVSDKKRNIAFDIFKLILAFFVVLIHCGPFVKVDFMFCALKIAVPGFLIMSGFLFYKDGVYSDEDMAKRAFKFFLTSFKYMFVAFVATMLLEIIVMGFIVHRSVADMFATWFSGDLLANFVVYSTPLFGKYTYHLWYLIAVTFAYLAIYLAYKLHIGRVVKFLPLIFIVFFFLTNWLKYFPGQEGNITGFKTRNAWLLALPGITLGFDLAHLKRFKFHFGITLSIGLLGIAFFCLQYVEGKIYGGGFETLVTSILSASCLIVALDRAPLYGGRIYNLIVGKYMSLFVYVFHVFVFKCYVDFAYMGINDHLAIVAFFTTLGSYFVIHLFNVALKFGCNKIKSRLIRS